MSAAPSRPYRRLPGRRRILRLVSRSSTALWLGDDHLLQVDTVYFNESFKRFAYADIQTLLLRETPRGLAISTALGVIAAAFGFIAWGVSRDNSAATVWVFVGIALFWVVLLVVNLLRGKTCHCQLQTAAGPHVFPSLNRVRPARRAWRLITEKIEAAQGTLSSAELARQMTGQPSGPRVAEFDY